MVGQPEPDLEHAVAFSFYATKNLTTAEGGALTAAPDLLDEARLWSLHGMSRDAWKRYGEGGSWFYEVVRPGYKCNMTDLQAAIGLHQLRRLPDLQRRRREVVDRYRAGLGDLPEVELPTERDGFGSALHLFVLRLVEGGLTIGRNDFIDGLGKRKIGASVHFIPVHTHPYYRDRYGWAPEDFPIAWREYQRMVSLPLHPGLTDTDVDDVVEAVRDLVLDHRR
jgi:dTDP-4-amino-4,6-dideoxygalactose transaminase